MSTILGRFKDIKLFIDTLDNSVLSLHEYYMLGDIMQELIDETVKTNIIDISHPNFFDNIIGLKRNKFLLRFDLPKKSLNVKPKINWKINLRVVFQENIIKLKKLLKKI